MFDRITSIATGTADLVRAEGELLVERCRRFLSWSLVLAAGTTVVMLGGTALIVAGVAYLATITGWIAAVAIAGCTGLCIGGATIVIARKKSTSSLLREELPISAPVRAEQARARIEGRDLGDESKESSDDSNTASSASAEGDDSRSWQDRVAQYAVENPGISIAGVSAVVALLGPGKTLKYAGRTAMLVGLARKVAKHATEEIPENESSPQSATQESRSSLAPSAAPHSNQRAHSPGNGVRHPQRSARHRTENFTG